MSDVDFAKQMYQLLQTMQQINKVAASLPGPIQNVFVSVSLDMPRFSPAELGCIRVVSWLFVQHFEAGRVGVAFLESRATAYGHDPNGRVKRHRDLIRRLRTLLQHNLEAHKQHDRDIQKGCEQWFRDQCGTAVPSEERHWVACLSALLTEAQECFDILLETVRSIESDESREIICRDWMFRIRRYCPTHFFDELIAKVAIDMGRDEINSMALRKRFYDSWTNQLTLIREDIDVETEARKLVEYAILTLLPKMLPITGKDLMDEFGLGPGPLIGSLLESAQTMYDASPCPRDKLLDRLKVEILPKLRPS